MIRFYVNFTYDNENYELTLPCPDIDEYFLYMGLPSAKKDFYKEMEIHRLECAEFDFSHSSVLDLSELNRLLMELNYLSEATIFLVGLLTKSNGNTFEAFRYSLKNYDKYDYLDKALGETALGRYILTDVFGTNIASSAVKEAFCLEDVAREAIYNGMVYEFGTFYVIRKNELLHSATQGRCFK